jgi:hypothetical protein
MAISSVYNRLFQVDFVPFKLFGWPDATTTPHIAAAALGPAHQKLP